MRIVKLLSWTYSIFLITLNLLSPLVYYSCNYWWILPALTPVINGIDFVLSENPWKNVQIMRANGFTPTYILLVSVFNVSYFVYSYYSLFRVQLADTIITYRFDLSLIITTIVLLAISDFLFYLAHKLLHITDFGAKIHLMHHCCIFSSQTTNLWFHPLDLAIEFFGPFALIYIWYCINGDVFEFIFITSILQAWYALSHDQNIHLPHYNHHKHNNSDYPIYISYKDPDPRNKVKHLVKNPLQ
eukprot:524689_1